MTQNTHHGGPLEEAAEGLMALMATTSPDVDRRCEQHCFVILDQLRGAHFSPPGQVLTTVPRTAAHAVALAALQATEGNTLLETPYSRSLGPIR